MDPIIASYVYTKLLDPLDRYISTPRNIKEIFVCVY